MICHKIRKCFCLDKLSPYGLCPVVIKCMMNSHSLLFSSTVKYTKKLSTVIQLFILFNYFLNDINYLLNYDIIDSILSDKNTFFIKLLVCLPRYVQFNLFYAIYRSLKCV